MRGLEMEEDEGPKGDRKRQKEKKRGSQKSGQRLKDDIRHYANKMKPKRHRRGEI